MNLLAFLHPSTATVVLDRPAADRDLIATLTADLRDQRVLTQQLTRTVLKLRRVLRMSPDAATATCAEWAVRCCELRAENERLTLRVAELEGRPTAPDWTGTWRAS